MRSPKRARRYGVSLLNFRDWQVRAKSFEEIGGYRFDTFNLSGIGSPQRLIGQEVTGNYFAFSEFNHSWVELFTEEEEKFTPVGTAILISDSLWRTTFGSDPNILGRTLNLRLRLLGNRCNAASFFEFVRKTDLWAPLGGWLEPFRLVLSRKLYGAGKRCQTEIGNFSKSGRR